MSKATQIYDNAISKRGLYPLANGGLYKLQEVEYWMDRATHCVGELIDYRNGRSRSRVCSGCLWEDRAAWLRSIVCDVPWRLGYEVNPAIKALAFDGLKQGEIISIQKIADLKIPFLLDLVDQVDFSINTNLQNEYGLWRTDRSLVRDLLVEIRDFSGDIAGRAEYLLDLHEVSDKKQGCTHAITER